MSTENKSNEVKDNERRERLHEFFKQDPSIWQDILDECFNPWHNEYTQLRAKTTPNRDYSAGYVRAYEDFMNLKTRLTKSWKTQMMQGQQPVVTP